MSICIFFLINMYYIVLGSKRDGIVVFYIISRSIIFKAKT